MVENCFGTMALPLSVALNVKVNGKTHLVPMATEEPSVVAAVSATSKLIAANGGFVAEEPPSSMVAQIQVLECEDLEAAAAELLAKKDEVISAANEFCPGMVKRGGGAKDVEARVLK